MEMPELGMIEPGRFPWFPRNKFEGYLWDKGDAVYISIIESREPGKGNLSKLFDDILTLGKAVKVPTPFAHMLAILKHKGFKPTVEDTTMGGCEVWVKFPPNTNR